VRKEVQVERRIWEATRAINLALTHQDTRKTIGIECKFQGVKGTAEEKIPSTIRDIEAWPIAGLVVFAGNAFTQNMKSFLVSTGKAVELCDIEPWLRLYFGLPEPAGRL